jgi:hypothetical protein
MIPNFGDILTKHTFGANTPESARAKYRSALREFWTTLLDANSNMPTFIFSGTLNIPPAVIPVVAPIGSFNNNTQLYIPTDGEIKAALATVPNVWLGIYNLFTLTIVKSNWFVDCKSFDYNTPVKANLISVYHIKYAEIYANKIKKKAPGTRDEAMECLNKGVKEYLQSVINVVPYTGTGEGTLTGTITVLLAV